MGRPALGYQTTPQRPASAAAGRADRVAPVPSQGGELGICRHLPAPAAHEIGPRQSFCLPVRGRWHLPEQASATERANLHRPPQQAPVVERLPAHLPHSTADRPPRALGSGFAHRSGAAGSAIEPGAQGLAGSTATISTAAPGQASSQGLIVSCDLAHHRPQTKPRPGQQFWRPWPCAYLTSSSGGTSPLPVRFCPARLQIRPRRSRPLERRPLRSARPACLLRGRKKRPRPHAGKRNPWVWAIRAAALKAEPCSDPQTSVPFARKPAAARQQAHGCLRPAERPWERVDSCDGARWHSPARHSRPARPTPKEPVAALLPGSRRV